MNTNNRFIEIGQQIAISQSRFVGNRRFTSRNFWASCQHPNQPRDPSDVQRLQHNLITDGMAIAGELFQQSITPEALERSWQVLAEASWYALNQLRKTSGITAPSGNPREWFARNSWEINQRLVNQTTPAIRSQIESIYRDRFSATTAQSQGQSWGSNKQSISDSPVDSDTFVLDVLQFFFDERLTVGQLNDHLRRLAAYALNEAIRASSTLDFVPRPPSIPPSVIWLVGQAVQIAFRRIQREQGIYNAVRVTVKARLRTEYELAKMGIEGSLSISSFAFSTNNLMLSNQGFEFIRNFEPATDRNSLTVFENTVKNSAKVNLVQTQFDALVSFCQGISIDRFTQSEALKALNEGNNSKVASEIKKWINAEGGQILMDLRARRDAEANLFSLGIYQPMNQGLSNRSYIQSYHYESPSLSYQSSGYSQAKNPGVIAGIALADAIQIGLGGAAIVQSGVGSVQGGFSLNYDKAQRILSTEARSEMPGSQSAKQSYSGTLFYLPQARVGTAYANIIIEWAGNPHGEIETPTIRRDLNTSSDFSKSTANFNINYKATIPSPNSDPRTWPLVFTYTGSYDPLGNGQWEFDGEFEINAFGGIKFNRHVVVSRSFADWVDSTKPEDWVQKGADNIPAVPSVPAEQMAFLRKKLP